mmetsp:Transcript_6339/g.18832  ORF Transcript_6339/g.18832 Transcript_6339/m.18832 type:complete len:554 (-) Transcript_6339:221-1882(-)
MVKVPLVDLPRRPGVRRGEPAPAVRVNPRAQAVGVLVVLFHGLRRNEAPLVPEAQPQVSEGELGVGGHAVVARVPRVVAGPARDAAADVGAVPARVLVVREAPVADHLVVLVPHVVVGVPEEAGLGVQSRVPHADNLPLARQPLGPERSLRGVVLPLAAPPGPHLEHRGSDVVEDPHLELRLDPVDERQVRQGRYDPLHSLPGHGHLEGEVLLSAGLRELLVRGLEAVPGTLHLEAARAGHRFQGSPDSPAVEARNRGRGDAHQEPVPPVHRRAEKVQSLVALALEPQIQSLEGQEETRCPRRPVRRGGVPLGHHLQGDRGRDLKQVDRPGRRGAGGGHLRDLQHLEEGGHLRGDLAPGRVRRRRRPHFGHLPPELVLEARLHDNEVTVPREKVRHRPPRAQDVLKNCQRAVLHGRRRVVHGHHHLARPRAVPPRRQRGGGGATVEALQCDPSDSCFLGRLLPQHLGGLSPPKVLPVKGRQHHRRGGGGRLGRGTVIQHHRPRPEVGHDGQRRRRRRSRRRSLAETGQEEHQEEHAPSRAQAGVAQATTRHPR